MWMCDARVHENSVTLTPNSSSMAANVCEHDRNNVIIWKLKWKNTLTVTSFHLNSYITDTHTREHTEMSLLKTIAWNATTYRAPCACVCLCHAPNIDFRPAIFFRSQRTAPKRKHTMCRDGDWVNVAHVEAHTFTTTRTPSHHILERSNGTGSDGIDCRRFNHTNWQKWICV